MKHRRSLISILLLSTLTVAPPAMAHVAQTSDGAAYVWNQGLDLNVKDMKADAHSVYGNANNTAHRLDNNSGSGTTVKAHYSFTVTSLRACVNRQRQPDLCSAWR